MSVIVKNFICPGLILVYEWCGLSGEVLWAGLQENTLGDSDVEMKRQKSKMQSLPWTATQGPCKGTVYPTAKPAAQHGPTQEWCNSGANGVEFVPFPLPTEREREREIHHPQTQPWIHPDLHIPELKRNIASAYIFCHQTPIFLLFVVFPFCPLTFPLPVDPWAWSSCQLLEGGRLLSLVQLGQAEYHLVHGRSPKRTVRWLKNELNWKDPRWPEGRALRRKDGECRNPPQRACASHTSTGCARRTLPSSLRGLASSATSLDLSPSGLMWSSSLISEFHRLRSL